MTHHMAAGLGATVALVLCVAASAAGAAPALAAGTPGIDLCTYFQTHPVDPCLPGGKYDPLLQRCTGADPGTSCYPCYSGENCKTFDSSPGCMIISEGGNPLVFQEYWEAAATDSCTATPVSYRQGYQNQGDSAPLAPIEEAICDLHKAVGNAECEGHEVVLGFGSTQVMASALYAQAAALALVSPASEMMHVAIETPYYMHYPYQANVTTVPTAAGGYRTGAVFDAGAEVTAPNTVQIVTRPNNPNGEMRTATAPDDRAIYDLAYNWPQFTSQYNGHLNHSLMIFTASKMAGMAGARFGWALVKNPVIAGLMREYITDQTLGLEIGSQMRGLNVIRHLAASGPTGGMFAFATAKMTARWETVRSIFNATTKVSLQNTCADSEPRCGAYAWVKCPDGINCFNLFAAGGVSGVPGPAFGSTKEHLRFTLMMRTVEMDLAFERMRGVMASPMGSIASMEVLTAEAPPAARHRRSKMGGC